MESKQIRFSVIARRSMRCNGLFRSLDHERVIEKHNQPNSNSGFTVIPTKELSRVYLQKPVLLASRGIVDARSTPPHDRRKSLKKSSVGLIANQRRYDQQNSNSKAKIGKGENQRRRFSPLGFGTDSGLRDNKKVQYFSLEMNSKEMNKLCDEKDSVVREVGSMLMVSTSRDSVLSLKRISNDRVAAAESKLRHLSSSSFISKDEKEDSLDCANGSPGCQTNTEEAHQPSPVSVLEPIFTEDMLDDGEEIPYFDIDGVEEQLETQESYSECCGMEVSSDEESVFDSETEESKESEPIGLSDSSYIDDILAEVVLGDMNWIPDKRDSLDLVVTPKIFEKLEKKYYTETSWKSFERRILFDRVISGLVEILESFRATPTWKKPVSQRLGTVLSTCGLKQELWKVLDRQEKRAKKESLAKVPDVDIDEWLELEADDESVVCEIESMIVDELLDEVISFI